MRPIILLQALRRKGVEDLGHIARMWYDALSTSINYARRADWLEGCGVTLPNCPEMRRIFDLLNESPAAEIYRSHIGPVLAIPYDHALMRWRGSHTPAERIKFHRDRDAISPAFPMNAWIPLTAIDRDTLGLAFEIDGAIVEPTFEPGDIAIFNRDTPHGPLPPKSRDRISIEFRIGPELGGMDGVVLYPLEPRTGTDP